MAAPNYMEPMGETFGIDACQGDRRRGPVALGWVWCALVAVLAWAGCRTADPNIPKTDSLAALVIYGADLQDIRKAARDVFQEDQFMQGETNATLLTFEKRGSMWNDITYGSFLNKEAWVRAKLTIQLLEESQHLLECRVFMVRDYGENFFEEESKVSRFQRGHYQDLLEQIRLRVLDSAVSRDSVP